MKRATLGSLVIALVLLVMPAPAALAHTELILSTPQDGAVLEAPPTEVVLTFSEELLPDAVDVSVTDGTGVVITVGDPKVDGSDVIVTWPPGLLGPDYTVNFRVVSDDGHPVTGSIGFTAGMAASAGIAASTAPTSGPSTASTPVPAATVASDVDAETSSAPSPLLLAVAAGLAVGAAVGLAFLWRRTRRSGPREA